MFLRIAMSFFQETVNVHVSQWVAAFCYHMHFSSFFTFISHLYQVGGKIKGCIFRVLSFLLFNLAHKQNTTERICFLPISSSQIKRCLPSSLEQGRPLHSFNIQHMKDAFFFFFSGCQPREIVFTLCSNMACIS